MGKYRKKPVIIEAFRWTGDKDQVEDPEWIVEAIKEGTVSFDRFARLNRTEERLKMLIETLEGQMIAMPGDWIIRGNKGEIYPCKPEIFEATYERIETDE